VADLAGTTTLTAELSTALDGVRGPRPRHDPRRVLVDLAVAIADGAEAISDIAVLADQPALFGSVASDSTCWRLLDALGDPELAAVAAGLDSGGRPRRRALPGHRGGRRRAHRAPPGADLGGLSGRHRGDRAPGTPAPGAQLDLIEEADGYRYTALAIDTPTGQHAWLDARHRAHARVEDASAEAATPGWAGCPAAASGSTRPG